MTDKIDDEAIEEPLEMAPKGEVSRRKRRNQIRREIEEAEEKRRLNELFDDFDD